MHECVYIVILFSRRPFISKEKNVFFFFFLVFTQYFIPLQLYLRVSFRFLFHVLKILQFVSIFFQTLRASAAQSGCYFVYIACAVIKTSPRFPYNFTTLEKKTLFLINKVKHNSSIYVRNKELH